jgi:GeoRSP system PqqD family protein
MKLYRNPDAVWREEDVQKEKALKDLDAGEDISDAGTSIILLHGKMHALNLLGTEIWKLCDGKTMEEIVSDLSGCFDVEPEVLREDVHSFLMHLKELGVIYEK